MLDMLLVSNDIYTSTVRIAETLSPEAKLAFLLYVLPIAPGSIISARLSTFFGLRQPLLFGSALLFTLAAFGMAFAQNTATMLACSTLAGLAAGSICALAEMITRDVCQVPQFSRVDHLAITVNDDDGTETDVTTSRFQIVVRYLTTVCMLFGALFGAIAGILLVHHSSSTWPPSSSSTHGALHSYLSTWRILFYIVLGFTALLALLNMTGAVRETHHERILVRRASALRARFPALPFATAGERETAMRDCRRHYLREGQKQMEQEQRLRE